MYLPEGRVFIWEERISFSFFCNSVFHCYVDLCHWHTVTHMPSPSVRLCLQLRFATVMDVSPREGWNLSCISQRFSPERGRTWKSQPALLMERLSRSSACPLGLQPVIRQKENTRELATSSPNAVDYKRQPLILTSAFIPLLCDCAEGTPPRHSRPTGRRRSWGEPRGAERSCRCSACTETQVSAGKTWATRRGAPWTTCRPWRCTSGTRSSWLSAHRVNSPCTSSSSSSACEGWTPRPTPTSSRCSAPLTWTRWDSQLFSNVLHSMGFKDWKKKRW